jgi:predicted ArsR family transcriptional regulator
MDWSDEIAEKTRLDPRTVKGHAQRFEEAGVVAKVPIARPTGGKPGIGYEVRWRNIDVLIGLALAHLPPKSRASARFAALLGMMP